MFPSRNNDKRNSIFLLPPNVDRETTRLRLLYFSLFFNMVTADVFEQKEAGAESLADGSGTYSSCSLEKDGKAERK